MRKFVDTNVRYFPLLSVVVLFGFIARLCISWYSTGSNDAITWQGFSDYIIDNGLFSAYTNLPLMNHPPLAAEWSVFANHLANIFGWPYFFAFRLPMVMADVGSCYLLWRIYKQRSDSMRGWQVAAIYSWSLSAVLISSYHGNTDSIYAFFCLLTMYYVQEKRSFFRAGLALAAAINIKLVPVLLIVPLFMLCRSRREVLLLFCSLGIGVLPFLPPLIVVTTDFYSNVFHYNSTFRLWGITIFLVAAKAISLLKYYTLYGRYVILLTVAATSWFVIRYKHIQNAYEVGAITVAIFLVLAPGFAIQYTVAIIPLLFAANLTFGVTYSIVSSVYAISLYYFNWTGDLRLYSHFSGRYPLESTILGLFTFVVLVKFLSKALSQRTQRIE